MYSFFTLRYFVYYAPLLCAVCKFRYSLLPRPYFIASFYGAISVTTFVEVGSFFGGPDHQPCLPQHLVSSFVFIVFSFISFCSRLKVVFCIVIIIFSLFVGIYFSLWFGNSKTFADCERVVFGIGPCPFILPNWPLPVHFAWNWPLPVHFMFLASSSPKLLMFWCEIILEPRPIAWLDRAARALSVIRKRGELRVRKWCEILCKVWRCTWKKKVLSMVSNHSKSHLIIVRPEKHRITRH